MAVHLRECQYYARGRRHEGEVYQPAVTPIYGSNSQIWVQVDGARESLVWSDSPDGEELCLASNTYIYSPVYSEHAIYWVERVDGAWVLQVVPLDAGKRPVCTRQHVIPTAGRPKNLAVCTHETADYLVWEERSGKVTRVVLAKLETGQEPLIAAIADGTENAYDPAVCVDAAGGIHVAWCAFQLGQYVVLYKQLTGTLQPVSPALRLSDAGSAALYPSLAPRKGGGVWYSFAQQDKASSTASASHDPDDDGAFLKHARARLQHLFFGADFYLHVGVVTDGEILVESSSAAGRVENGRQVGHSRVLELPDGTPCVLARQHMGAVDVVYESTNRAPLKSAAPGIKTSAQTYAGVSLFVFGQDGWQDPIPLVSHAFIDAPISCQVNGDMLRVALMDDKRHSGWGTDGEWFDHDSECAVGLATVQISLEDTAHPALVSYTPGADTVSLMNPVSRNKRAGEYQCILGQTHAHSSLSVCIRVNDRDIDMNYRFMQDVQHCDFGGTTDHVYNMWHTEMLLTRKAAEYYYVPGEFVAFPAYEWTGSGTQNCSHEDGPWGHLNPLYLEEDGDLEFHTPVDATCPGGSARRLWKEYAGKHIVTPPHHVASKAHPFNWDVFDSTFIPVIELFQDFRGSGEQAGAPGVTAFDGPQEECFALKYLLAGKRFGFICGADHGGFALAGALVRSLTRTDLYEAFCARRCYGTTGADLSVSFMCNGESMGAEVETDSAAFALHVEAGEAVAEIQVVRNGEIVDKLSPVCNIVDHMWELEKLASGEFWYSRILLENGEVCWTSPIWLI